MGNLANELRGNVAPAMVGNSRRAAISVAKLHVGTTLADANEAQGRQQLYNLARLEHGQFWHALLHRNELRADKLSCESRFAILE